MKFILLECQPAFFCHHERIASDARYTDERGVQSVKVYKAERWPGICDSCIFAFIERVTRIFDLFPHAL